MCCSPADSQDLDVLALAEATDDEGGGRSSGDDAGTSDNSSSDGEWVMLEQPAPSKPQRKKTPEADAKAPAKAKPVQPVEAAPKKRRRKEPGGGGSVFAAAEDYEHLTQGVTEEAPAQPKKKKQRNVGGKSSVRTSKR